MWASICGPPTPCKEGGTGEGRSFGEGPRDKAERRVVVSLRWLRQPSCGEAARQGSDKL